MYSLKTDNNNNRRKDRHLKTSWGTGKVGGKREGKKLENINIVLILNSQKTKIMKLKRAKIISIFVTCLVSVFKFIQN